MAISYIGSGTGTTSATFPTHAAGDMLVIFSYNSTSTSIPSLPSGFTNLGTSTGTTSAYRLSYRIATAAGTTTGTLSSTTGTIAAAYSKASANQWFTPVIGTVGTSAASTNWVTGNGTATTTGYSNQWILLFGGTSSINSTIEAVTTATNTATLRANFVGTNVETVLYDSNAHIASNGSNATQTIAIGGTAGNSMGIKLRLVEYAPISATSSTTDANDTVLSYAGGPYAYTGTGWDSTYDSYQAAWIARPTYSSLIDDNDTATYGAFSAWPISKAMYTTGKRYAEITVQAGTVNSVAVADHNIYNGLYKPVASGTAMSAVGPVTGSYSIPGLGTIVAGDTVSYAVDFDNNIAWIRRNGGSWYGWNGSAQVAGNTPTSSGGTNPGLAFGRTPGSAYGISAQLTTAGAKVLLRTRNFLYALPTNFTPWGQDSDEKTVISQITTNSDDGYETFTSGVTSAYTDNPDASSDSGRAGGNSTAQYLPFWRFTGISIPQGATITHANLAPTVPVVGSTSTIVAKLQAVADDNVSAFTTGSRPSTRTLDANQVDYYDRASDPDSSFKNVKINSIVQAIVSRSGWTSGNALGIVSDSTFTSTNNWIRTGDTSLVGGTGTYANTGRGAVLKTTFTVSRSASLASTDSDDTLSSNSQVAIKSTLASTDADDTVVADARPPRYYIFDHSSKTFSGSFNDGQNLVTGIRFAIAKTVKITHVSIWKTSADALTSREVAIYNNAGTQVAFGTSSSEPTGVGQWIDIPLNTPLTLTGEGNLPVFSNYYTAVSVRREYPAVNGYYSITGYYDSTSSVYTPALTETNAGENNRYDYIGSSTSVVNATSGAGAGADYGMDLRWTDAPLGVNATLASTDDSDTLSSNAALQIKASLSSTDVDDLLSSTSTLAIRATLSTTDSSDTLSSNGTLLIKGTLSSTDASDTLVSTATLLIKATLGTTDADETLSANGILQLTTTGTLASTDSNDTVSSTATLLIKGTLSVTDASDTLTSSGALLIKGTLAVTEGDDTLDSLSFVGDGHTGFVANFDENDTLSSIILRGVEGTVFVYEGDDTVVSASRIAIRASLGASDVDDILSSVGLLKLSGTLSVTDMDDFLTAFGGKPREASLSLTDDSDILISIMIRIPYGIEENESRLPYDVETNSNGSPFQTKTNNLYTNLPYDVKG